MTINELPSFVFLSTPTSGTGSLWRVISAIAACRGYSLDKVAERYMNEGRGDELETWEPEPNGMGYMYNTPHVVNRRMAEGPVRLIANFRDPRDMACNQYHWVFQHPDASRTPEQLESHRESVRAGGIDAFVLRNDNNIQFRQFFAARERLLQGRDADVLVVSYAQLCLDFDGMVGRIARFLGVADAELPWDVLDLERTDRLEENPDWIGRMWSGTDTAPGRHRRELADETVRALDDKYRDVLAFLRRIEAAPHRHLLSTGLERADEAKVVQGRGGLLFLQGDANDTQAQIRGDRRLSANDIASIATIHRARRDFGAQTGFRYAWVIAPSKEVIHRAALPEPDDFERAGPRPVRQYIESSVGRALYEPFYQPEALAALESPPFALEDTHWTHAGALAYLRAFLARQWRDAADRLSRVPLRTFESQQQGDLGVKLYRDPERISITAPAKRTARLAFTNGIPNEGCVRHYVREAGTGRRLLVLHDSFCMWWFDVLAELFDEVLFVHGTILDFGFAEQFAPTDVLCLQVERFLTRRPENGGDLAAFVEKEERAKRTDTPFSSYRYQLSR